MWLLLLVLVLAFISKKYKPERFRNLQTLNWGQQCGGKGGECSTRGNCVDSPWPGTTCPVNAACIRRNEWHWQCDPAPQASQARQLEWGEQCGGKGGSCGTKGQCVDSPWPGVKCPPNAACIRRNEWHWQCDPAPKASLTPMPPSAQTKLKLIWSDEFAGPQVDASKWDFHEGDGTDYTGVKGWGNNELQCYTRNAENIKIQGGTLVLTAKRGGTCVNARENRPADASITSAKIVSKRAFVYGANPIIVSARIKVPMGKGSFPAFWLIPMRPWSSGTGTHGTWCHSGEIDIMEHINAETWVKSTVIYYNKQTQRCDFDGNQLTIANPGDWHTYSCLWSKEFVKTYVDNQPIHVKDIRASPMTPDNPMHIALNLAVGGDWAKNDTSDLPYSMYVDYVRVHEVLP